MKPETGKAAANPALPSLSSYSKAHSEPSEPCAGKLQVWQPAPGWPRAAAVWVPQAPGSAAPPSRALDWDPSSHVRLPAGSEWEPLC